MGSAVEKYYNLILNHFRSISAQTLGWLAILMMHCAFIPNILTVLMGISDRLPSVDVVLFVWTGLMLFFIRAAIAKDILNIVTGGIGFFIQAVLLALVVFK
jgi:hypothetical protein